MSYCKDCGCVQRERIDGLWCSWCKTHEPSSEPDVRQLLQNEWER